MKENGLDVLRPSFGVQQPSTSTFSDSESSSEDTLITSQKVDKWTKSDISRVITPEELAEEAKSKAWFVVCASSPFDI